jgi:hypothetical protein
MDWEALAARGEARYDDGLKRLPAEPDPRQKQLVRMAMAAGSVGLARLMLGASADAGLWLDRSAVLYRESFEAAPPGSWGRPIGAIKSRVLAGDWDGARADAAWALEQDPAAAGSAIGTYAALLATLILEDDAEARRFAASLRAEDAEAFPRPVTETLAALAAGEREAYAAALQQVLESFETREAYLEDAPVADTVLVLEALAERRGIAARPESALLPTRAGPSGT